MKRLCLLYLCLCVLLCGCATDTPVSPEENGPAASAGDTGTAPGSPSSTAPSGMDGAFVLSFIHIGKADSFLLTLPDGGHYLLDTGKASDFGLIARLLESRGIETLDGIFLSHGHKDHAGSLEKLVTLYPTAVLYLSALDTVTYQAIDARGIAAAHGVRVEELAAGDRLSLGGGPDPLQIDVLAPLSLDPDKENNNSLVLRLTYGDTVFLMMGDAEKAVEKDLLQAGIPLQADVLKLGHHGKDDATTEEFLAQVQPTYALITGNAQDDPDTVNAEIADRLAAYRVQPYYSDGTWLSLDFVTDGHTLSVQPYEP